jgi:hypothetical protein
MEIEVRTSFFLPSLVGLKLRAVLMVFDLAEW